MAKDNIICDLDGTLALDEGRAEKYLRRGFKDWDGYFAACVDDEPNWDVIHILGELIGRNHIWILSGRSESVREQTEQWLDKHRVDYDQLIMREVNDRTQDNELKLQWARTRDLTPDRVWFILEDRQRMVDAWRAEGYTTLQVAPGAF